MKKKLLILALAIIAIVSVFAISVSAEEADPYASYYDKVYTAIDGTPLALYEKDGETYYPLAWFYDSANGVYESFRVGTEVNFMKTDGVTPLPYGTDFTQNTPVVFSDSTKTYTMANLILINLHGSRISHFSGSWTNLPIQAIYCNVEARYVNGSTFNKNQTLSVFDIPKAHTGALNLCGFCLSNCPKLTYLYIPQNGYIASNSVFEYSGLTKVEFAENWQPQSWFGGQIAKTMPGYVFNGCASLKEVTLPKTVTSVGPAFFMNCTSLETVELPEGLTSIPGTVNQTQGMFSGCSSLKSITIPSAVTSIAYRAFQNCKALESVTFNGTELETIGDAAFENCIKLTSIVIPEGVTTIGGVVFKNCSTLASVTLPSTLETLGIQPFQGTVLTEVIGLENTQLKAIPFECFRGIKTWKPDVIKLPNTCTTIGSHAFADTGVKKIILGAAFVDMTGSHPFTGCSSLKEVVAPATTTTLPPVGDSRVNIKFIFVTSSEETVLNKVSSTTGFTNIITYQDYVDEKYDTSKSYIVSGYNLCVAFYDGHQIDESAATGKWLGDAYISQYKVSCECGRNCGKEAVLVSLDPLFKSNGFSSNTDSMMQSFAVNKKLIEAYKPYLGDIKFGLVAAYCGVGENFDTTNGVLVNADGTGVNNKVAIVDFTEREYDVFEMKIVGIGDTTMDTEFYFCAYVIENGTVNYIHNNTTADKAAATTYTAVAALDNTKYDYLPVANKEEE